MNEPKRRITHTHTQVSRDCFRLVDVITLFRIILYPSALKYLLEFIRSSTILKVVQ